MHNLVGKPHTHKCHDHPLPMRCIAIAQSSCRRTVCCAELSRPPLAAPARPIEPTWLGWLWFLRCPRSASSLSAHPLWLARTFGVSIRSIVASHWSSDAEPLAGRAAAAAAAAAGRDGSLLNEKAAMSNFARSSREPPDRQLPNRKRNSGQHEKQAERVSRTAALELAELTLVAAYRRCPACRRAKRPAVGASVPQSVWAAGSSQ